MKEDIRPIFIFSLPRSGSTLLQRSLASHPKISTTAETWFLLPLLYMLQDNGIKTEYGYSKFRKGFSDFRNQIKEGDKNSYEKLLRQFVLNNYKLASNNDAIYFLDKTPRYSLICDKIIELFPNGKFIFLWRNPLAVVSSMIESWGGGNWNVYKYHIDLFKGFNNLINTCNVNEHQVLEINYEDFVRHPEANTKNILQYLNLEYSSNLVREFKNVNFAGKMGDQMGTLNYSKITTNSINKWKETYTNPVRKKWAYRHLDHIGKAKLSRIGYDVNDLKDQLKKNDFSINHLLDDLLRMSFGFTKKLAKNMILKQNVL
jgi:hypothetical protein